MPYKINIIYFNDENKKYMPVSALNKKQTKGLSKWAYANYQKFLRLSISPRLKVPLR